MGVLLLDLLLPRLHTRYYDNARTDGKKSADPDLELVATAGAKYRCGDVPFSAWAEKGICNEIMPRKVGRGLVG